MLLPVGALIGTIIAGWIIDKVGRKLTLLVCSITYAIGWLLITLTLLTNGTIFRLLIFAGRLIGGIGVGFATLCAPVCIIIYDLNTCLAKMCHSAHYIIVGRLPVA